MTTVDDTALAARFHALAPEPLASDWNDVIERAGLGRGRRGRLERSRPRSGRRRLAALALGALVVVAAASAVAGVREFLFGGPVTASYSAPSWSPDGRAIAFVLHRYSVGNGELNVTNADGSGRRIVADVGLAWGQPLAWSPDGRRIAFVRDVTGYLDVFVVGADGAGRRRLARGVKLVPNFGFTFPSPTWSPDGRRIVFVSDRSSTLGREVLDRRGGSEIYVMNADGRRTQRLTRNTVEDDSPVWSPDGRQIAFVRRIRATGSPRRDEIRVMNADGSGERGLARGQSPHWSPDGRRIAFRSDRDGNGEIYVMNADGSGQRRLTHSPVSDGEPAWSPDGRKILFTRAEFLRGNSEVYVTNPDGSGQRNLTRNPAQDSRPAWSPDGRKIVFVSKRDGNGEVYVMNADGSGQRNLTRLKGGK